MPMANMAMKDMPSHRDTILDQFSRQAVPFSTAAPIRDEGALQLIVAAAGTGPDDTVLDVACGPGLVACAFARIAWQVTGIDLTPAMIERAEALAAENGCANVRFQIGDVLPLPFPDVRFSIVVSRFAFHHFQDPAAVLAEMRRVCRIGGRVVVADLMASPDPVKAAAFHRMEMLRDPSHARALALDALRALYHESGLSIPSETFWHMDIDVNGLLARSFPEPGNEPVIRRMFEDSVADDALGLETRREAGRLRFTYSNVVLSAVR
jgi:ubiquinone/menaquinone biosynthesis C-methylase UbiE